MPKTMILYGESGTSKTSQIYHIAKYIYNKYGKRTRLIAADGGGYQPILEGGLIELGFVEVFDVTQISRPYLDLRRLGDGFWPRDGRFDGTDFCRTKPDEWKEIGVIAIEGITSIARILLTTKIQLVIGCSRSPSQFLKKSMKPPGLIEDTMVLYRISSTS